MTNATLKVGDHNIPATISPIVSLSPDGLRGEISLTQSQMLPALQSASPFMAQLSIGGQALIPVQIGMSPAAVPNGNQELRGIVSVKSENLTPLVVRSFTATALSAKWSDSTETADAVGQKTIKKRMFTVEPEDFLGIGVLFLMFSASITVVLIAIFMGLRMIDSQDGVKIILGCVSGAAIAAVVRGIVSNRKKKK
jgi:hypothetical protein